MNESKEPSCVHGNITCFVSVVCTIEESLRNGLLERSVGEVGKCRGEIVSLWMIDGDDCFLERSFFHRLKYGRTVHTVCSVISRASSHVTTGTTDIYLTNQRPTISNVTKVAEIRPQQIGNLKL
jgi:hypothetical protein